MRKARVPTSFYADRGLPVPEAEYVPGNSVELQSLICDLDGDIPRQIVGSGEHVRVCPSDDYEAIRTTECDHILELDRVSKTVRVEAGVTWSALRDALAEENLSMQRYRLYPGKATIGGLLARRLPTQKPLFAGDIRDGCVALSAANPSLGDYRYMVAPRKASGPDLRHLFMGGEGALGVILEVTLEVWTPFPGRLYTWKASTAADAVTLFREIGTEGLDPSWCHWRQSTGEFVAAIHAPTRLQKAMRRRANLKWSGELDILGEERLAKRRDYLETHIPDRRSAKHADKVVAATYSLAHLADAVEKAGDAVDNVEVYDWSRHDATAYFISDETMSADDLPAETRRDALGLRAVLGHDEWRRPDWFDDLRGSLDPAGVLASRK